MADRDETVDAVPPGGPEELWENAPCGLVAARPDGTVSRVNRTFLAWTGYRPEDLVDRRRIRDLLPAGGRIYYETHLSPLLRLQGAVRGIAVDLLCADGRRMPALLNASLGHFAVFDATDRRTYERELLRERQRAEQADRVKADFISMISHEIRNPLQGILGISHLLDSSTPPRDQRELVRLLRQSCDNLLGLVNEILDFSKIESGTPALEERSFDLRHLVTGVAQPLVVRAAQKDLFLNTWLDERLPARLLGDPVKIGQVLTNLLSNAVKFTERGAVTLGVQVRDLSRDAVSTGFRVSDSGIGIPPEHLPHIFDGFTQAGYEIGQKYGGTGLGLAISQRLVELHGSRIQVESEVGRGTTFSFDLRLRISSGP